MGKFFLRISAFLYSKVWMANFKTRHNLSKFTISGEFASITVDRVKAEIEVKKTFTEKHGWHNIWNRDETALFYKLFFR